MKFFHSCALITCSLFAILLSSCTSNNKLPVLGQREAKEVKHKDGSVSVDTVYQTIAPFRFLNQDSIYIDNATFNNKIYIADFFFTSCTTICPTMHRNLKTIFEEYKDSPEVAFLSHTIDFKYDHPSVLKKYAKKLGVYGKNWSFAFGAKDSIYNIAEKSYLVAVMQDTTNKDGYIHQGWLVLIDKERRMRGAYDGTNPESIAQLKKDLPILLAEYKK